MEKDWNFKNSSLMLFIFLHDFEHFTIKSSQIESANYEKKNVSPNLKQRNKSYGRFNAIIKIKSAKK